MSAVMSAFVVAGLVLLMLPVLEAHFLHGREPSASLLFVKGAFLSLAGLLGFITVEELVTEIGTADLKPELVVWVGVTSACFWTVGSMDLWLYLMRKSRSKY